MKKLKKHTDPTGDLLYVEDEEGNWLAHFDMDDYDSLDNIKILLIEPNGKKHSIRHIGKGVFQTNNGNIENPENCPTVTDVDFIVDNNNVFEVTKW